MISPIDLTEAAQTLVAYCGPYVAASRRGGQLQFVTMLRERSGLTEAEATRIIAALEQRQALRWVSAHTPVQPCPGMLELYGFWHIEPQRLQSRAAA